MALNDVTISFDLNQLLGADFDANGVKAYVKTNVPNQTLIDTSTGEIRLGQQRVTIEADGTGTFTTWGVGADGNPISWQTSLVVNYRRAGSRDRVDRTFGPYTITDADDGKMLAELEDQQAIPPNYQSAFVADMEAIRDEAEAARDAAVDISNIDTSDGVVSTLIEGTAGAGPLTRSALSASTDQRLEATQPTGYDDFTTYADGAVPARTKSGHTLTLYDNSASTGYATGYTIASGRLRHPLGTSGTPSAAYAGIELPQQVRRIWADFEYVAGPGTGHEDLVLIVSSDLFARSTFADAASHFVLGATGWSYQKLQASPFGTTTLASGTFATPLAEGVRHRVAIEFDGIYARIYLPDGSVREATDPKISEWRGAHATIENFAFTGSAVDPVHVVAWGAAS